METKVCKTCSIEQPLSSYWTTDKARGYLRATCKACDKAYLKRLYASKPEMRAKIRARTKEWAKTHPRSTEDQRRYQLKSVYGITPADYDRMAEAQGHKCALCGTKEQVGRWSKLWHIDHCHKTDRIRGLLCQFCNTRLGSYEVLIETVGEDRLKAYLTG